MSFGFSLGDFLAVIELANKIRSRFVDAPDQFRAVSNEVKNLSNVLRDIDDVLPQRDLSDQQKIELEGIVGSCQDVLKELEDTLDRCQELNLNVGNLRGRSRRVWKRVRWDQERIDRSRSRITLNVLSLNTFLERISSRTIFVMKEGVDQLVSRQHDQDRQVILNWLTPVDYALQQNDFFSKRQEGTGQWLLNSDQFRNWVDQNNQTLFCPGIPGAGKTMCTAILVDALYSIFLNDESVGIAYIYCNFRQQYQQKPVDLLSSLLKQLVQGLPLMPQNVQRLYKSHQSQRTRPSFDEISQTLQSVVPYYSRKFLVIDALDECLVLDGGRRQFLTELFSLQAKSSTNILVTSRFIPEIEKEFQGKSIQLEISATREDLQRYLDEHILKLPSFVSRNTLLQEEIKNTIISTVDGMFLLAQLHLDSLIGKRSSKAIRAALEKLPKGSGAYDQAYREALERIEGQVADSCLLAKQVLSWITYAKRPLTTVELQHALAVEIDESEFDEDNLPDIADMVSVCAGLVAVDTENNIIRLVHYTTQEFFERTQRDWFPDAERDIAEICIAYLSLDVFESGICSSDEEFVARLQSNPFYDYAAQNWGYHMRQIQDTQPSIPTFLESERKVSACNQAMKLSTRNRRKNFNQVLVKQISSVHLATYHGLTNVVNLLIMNGYTIDLKDSYGQTPLSYAAKNGSEAIVRLLVERDNVEIDSKDKWGRTPLSYAARNGHEAIVQLLVERDDVEIDSKDKWGRTPLSYATESGHKAIVQLLVKRDDVEVDSIDEDNRTPLSYATESGHEAIVQLLVERDDVKVDSIDEDNQTPLSYAARNGHEAIVQLLVERDNVKVDLKDKWGRTQLSYAAGNGHKAIVQLLVERDDVKVDSKDKWGRTPLSYATESGHKAIVELLVKRDDVKVDSIDEDNRTPLSYAAEGGHEAVVRLLVERDDVKVDPKDRFGQTPFLWSVKNGHEAVMKLLINHASVDINSKDKSGQTPLSWAAIRGHKAAGQLLLADSRIKPDEKS